MKKTIEINYNNIKLSGSNKFKLANNNNENNSKIAESAVVTNEKPKKIIFKSKASSSVVDAKTATTTAAASTTTTTTTTTTTIKTSPLKLTRKLSSPNKSSSSSAGNGGRKLRLKRAHSDDDDDDNEDIFKFSSSLTSANNNKSSNQSNDLISSTKSKEALKQSPPPLPPSKSTSSTSPAKAKSSTNAANTHSPSKSSSKEHDDDQPQSLPSSSDSAKKPRRDSNQFKSTTPESKTTKTTTRSNKASPVSPKIVAESKSSSKTTSKPVKTSQECVKSKRYDLKELEDDDDESDNTDHLIKFNFKKSTNITELDKALTTTTTTITAAAAATTALATSTNNENGSKQHFKRKIFSTRSYESIKLKTQSIDFNYDSNNGDDLMTERSSSKPDAVLHNQDSSSSDDVFSDHNNKLLHTIKENSNHNLLNEGILLDDDADLNELITSTKQSTSSGKTNSKSKASSSNVIRVVEITATISNGTCSNNKRPIGLFEDDMDDFFTDKKSSSSKDNHHNQNNDDSEYFLLNTRKAYECEELGETQAFADDLFYLMDGLSDNFSTSQRCLSAIKLAEQCLSSEFRMHLRSSHGTLTKIFSLLADSPNDPSLALCTTCILFALSRDKLTIEMDKSILQLMISIINNKAHYANQVESTTTTTTTVNKSTKSKIFKSSKPSLTNDKDLYEKTFERCKTLCDKLISDSINTKDRKMSTSSTAANSPKSLKDSTLVTSLNNSESLDNKSSLDSVDAVQIPEQFEINTNDLNAQLLAMECLLNLTINRRASDWLKDELRLLGAFDNILDTISELSSKLKENNADKYTKLFDKLSSKSKRGKAAASFSVDKNNFTDFYMIKKLARCLKLLENITQASLFGSSYENLLTDLNENQDQITSTTSPLSSLDDLSNDSLSSRALALTAPPSSKKLAKTQSGSSSANANVKHLNSQELKSLFINHNYLLDRPEKHLLDTINDSLLTFFYELIFINESSSSLSNGGAASVQPVNPFSIKSSLITNGIKEIFLLIINLSHANLDCTKNLLSNKKLVDLVFIFIYKIVDYLNESDRFDILILAILILINVSVIKFNLSKIKSANKSKFISGETSTIILKTIDLASYDLSHLTSQLKSLDIVLNLYKTKEASVSLAETDQENELIQLNEQINSQNVENINLTVMNSISKAGKHMEEHIIAAHSAIILTYMLMDLKDTNDIENSLEFQSVKSKMVDKSFKNMTEIIRKFLSFMKIMKVSGFSAEEHLEELIDFLENS